MLIPKSVAETEQGWSIIGRSRWVGRGILSWEQFKWLEDNIKHYRVQKITDEEIHVVFKSKDDAMLAYLRL